MPVPDSVEHLEKPLLRSTIYETLRSWIIDGTLHPEERVRDGELAERLGVSRTPVREVLLQLRIEGLVEMEANRFTRIAPLNLAEAENIYEIVGKLDEFALTLAFARSSSTETHEMIELMEAANGRLASAIQRKDSAMSLEADSEFHGIIADASGNPELTQLLHGLRSRLRRFDIAFFSAGVGDQSVEEHERVLGALRDGKGDLASKFIAENWAASLTRFRANSETGKRSAVEGE